MPTYEDLRNYFQETAILRDAAKEASKVPIVRGYALDVDPLWSLAYDIEDGIADLSGDIWLRLYYLENFGVAPNAFLIPELASHIYLLGQRFQGYRRRNLFRSLKLWEKAQKLGPNGIDRRLPVTMTIVHRQLRSPIEVNPKEDSDYEALRHLMLIASRAPGMVRVEERPPARLALASGDAIQIGGRKSGTLGGVLTDTKSGDLFGVTCAHVAKSGDVVTDGSGAAVGSCSANTTLIALPSAKSCDPENLATPNPAPGNGPDLNMLDCALVKLTASISRPTIATVARTLTQGQNVVLQGAKSTTRHKLGSLCLSYQFTDSGQDYCFRDAIELLPQPFGPFGGWLGKLMTRIPTQGDSGGWVLTDNHPCDWAGMFFAEDGNRGFAIRATWVHAWAQRAIGSTLTV
jgi:hypothetical protein